MSGKVKEWIRSRACGIDNCKSTKYYVESGLSYCLKCGHLQEGVQTQQDDEDVGTQGRTTRRKRESQEKVSQVYRGHTAISLYLHCYQLILWKQCYALINTIGLTKELEQIVKDLWALRLQLVKEKAVATSDEDTVFSSQPVSDTDTGCDEKGDDKKWKMKRKKMPTLIETLALLYLGTVLLRLPVSMGDVHHWAVREDIPFMRAVRFVPTAMKQKLPAEYLKALDTTTPLQPDHLRKAIHNVSLFYAHNFKLIFPSINATLLLYKHLRDLALPITLHPITLSISALLDISFTFPSPTTRQRISSLPEVSLISLLVIATKLYHPFDEDKNPRHARSLTDPAVLAIDWAAWTSAQKDREARLNPAGSLSRGSEITITEKDVMSMSGDEIDQYLDYYARTFIDEERMDTKSRGLPKQLLDMFPTGRPDGSSPAQYNYKEQEEKEQAAIETTLESVIGSLKLRAITPVESDEPVHRIGSFYKRYRKVEDLNGYARVFHQKVAQIVGMKLEPLLLAVAQIERKLMVYKEAKAKK